MTVLLTHSEVSYEGDDASTVFPTTFRFLEDEHLRVQISTDDGTSWSTLVLGVGYDVDGAGDDEPGGSVTLTGHGVLAVGETLRLQRNTTDEQPTTFGVFTKFSPASHELELDRRTMVSQERGRRISALEAGTTTVLLEATDLIEDTFTAQEPIENTFPRNVACSGTPAGVALAGLVDTGEGGGAVLTELGVPDISSMVSGHFTVRHIPGLVPGRTYRATYLVLK